MLSGSPRTVAPQRRLRDELVGRLTVGIEPTGVLLGRDETGQPLPVRLFQPDPLDVTFVGGWWAAQVLVLRCLGYGAAVAVDAVDAADPAGIGTVATTSHWLAFDHATGGTGARVFRSAPGDAGHRPGPSRPRLLLRDRGDGAPPDQAGPLPWQTRLTVFPRITKANLSTATAGDLLLVQRLDMPEAVLLGSALGLSWQQWPLFTALDNQMIAAVRVPVVRHVWLTPTGLERQLFG